MNEEEIKKLINSELDKRPVADHNHTGLGISKVKDVEVEFIDVTEGNANEINHGYLPKLSDDTGDYLRGDGTWQDLVTVIEANLVTPDPFILFKDFPSTSGFTEFEGTANDEVNFSNSIVSVITFGDGTGAALEYGNVHTSLTYQKITKVVGLGTFSWNTNHTANANEFAAFFGIGRPYSTGGLAFTWTNNHIGIKITKSGGAAGVVYITNANGTTQTQTDVTTTWALDTNGDPILSDTFNFRFEITTTSIAFYANEILLGTHTTNIPTGSPAVLWQIATDWISGAWAANQASIAMNYFIMHHTF